ncbi:MAG TPA: flavin reductase family protein [Micromonosporaceae bacterium]|nr:flavin reductase family protein [Micromonosporaceae bacterium]
MRSGDVGVAPAFREVMAAVCTPVSVVTALDGDLPHGTTVSAFASLSMQPPMVLVSLARTSDLLHVIRRAGGFGVNVLCGRQSALARRFARKGGTTKFVGVPWELYAGVPRLPGAGGFLGCRTADLVPGGDHVIVLGDVVAAEPGAGPPLTYHARAFGTHISLDGAAG